jgi:hypothetical protein
VVKSGGISTQATRLINHEFDVVVLESLEKKEELAEAIKERMRWNFDKVEILCIVRRSLSFMGGG